MASRHLHLPLTPQLETRLDDVRGIIVGQTYTRLGQAALALGLAALAEDPGKYVDALRMSQQGEEE